MTRFSDVPNELIMGIWSYVIEPEDVESFALASKRIYGLSMPFVAEHARLKEQYSSVYFSRHTKERLADLLQKMLLNPRIAFYIREFEILRWAASWGERYDQCTPLSAITIDLFRDGIRCSSLIADSEVGNWIADIELGDEEPILALILMRLTKLEKLKLDRDSSMRDRYLVETLRRISESSKAAVHPKTSYKPIGDQNNASQPTFYNVTELDLENCNIELDILSRLLQSMRELKGFSYAEDEGSSVKLFQMCNVLLECSQYSLRRLHLFEMDDNVSTIGDVTRFKNLVELETNFVPLLGSKDDMSRSLADVLPISIEDVTLSSEEEITFETLERIVCQMVKSKVTHLPNLRTLTFVLLGDDVENPDIIDIDMKLRRKCREVGVSFSAQDLLDPPSP